MKAYVDLNGSWESLCDSHSLIPRVAHMSLATPPSHRIVIESPECRDAIIIDPHLDSGGGRLYFLTLVITILSCSHFPGYLLCIARCVDVSTASRSL